MLKRLPLARDKVQSRGAADVAVERIASILYPTRLAMGGRGWMCGACASSVAHVRTTATRVACVSPCMSTASQHALCRLWCQENVGTSRPHPRS